MNLPKVNESRCMGASDTRCMGLNLAGGGLFHVGVDIYSSVVGQDIIQGFVEQMKRLNRCRGLGRHD